MTLNNRKITHWKIIHYGNAGDDNWRKKTLYQEYYHKLYLKPTTMYLNYLTTLVNNPDNIPDLWKEYKQVNIPINKKYFNYEQNFKDHMNEFKQFIKPGKLLSIT